MLFLQCFKKKTKKEGEGRGKTGGDSERGKMGARLKKNSDFGAASRNGLKCVALDLRGPKISQGG